MINFATMAQNKMIQTFRQKRWQYVCIATPEFLFSCALVDATYAGNVFFFFADLPGRQVHYDQTFLCIPGLHLKINENACAGAAVHFKMGQSELTLTHAPDAPGFDLTLQSGDLSVDAHLQTRGSPEPLCVEVKENSELKTYTQKTSLLPVSGTLRFKEKLFSLENAFAGIDFTNGVLPRLTQWCWAFALGRLEDGTPISFNIAAGNHLGGQSENCVWIDGKRIALPPVVFRFNHANPLGSWKIDSADGSVALQFHSSGLHREDRNLLLIRSQFVQVCGVYRGVLTVPGGRKIPLSGLPGVAENQDVKW